MAFNITDFNNKWANFKEELKDYFNKRVVDKNGDTMLGSLVLASSPTEDMESSTKEYVDRFWTFTPGDCVLKSWSHDYQKQGVIYKTDDESITYNGGGVRWNSNTYNYIVGHTIEKHIPTPIHPQADGFLKLRLGKRYIFSDYFNTWVSSNGYNQNFSSTTDAFYDVKIIYRTDTLDDVVLYESKNISCFEKAAWAPDYIESVVPIKKYQGAAVVIQYTFTAVTDSLKSYSGNYACFSMAESHNGDSTSQYLCGNTALII